MWNLKEFKEIQKNSEDSPKEFQRIQRNSEGIPNEFQRKSKGFQLCGVCFCDYEEVNGVGGCGGGGDGGGQEEEEKKQPDR